ncbi:GDP-mannose 4,6-dehydratase, partial [Patescibacteria group bacterium]|nr:GDP-mannose 4,6-dehydratase [Patescibacteria group bacterium]
MRLLVTGGAGFIGSNFVRYMENKAEIIVVDALKYGSNLNNLKDLNHRFIQGNICDYNLVAELLKDRDAVVNFAAESHVDRSISDPYPFIETNIVGTYTILEAIRKVNSGIRFIHISTDEVYGDIEEGSFKEGNSLRPSSPYSASKASADMLVLSYVRTYNLNAVITRCTNNFGPYQFPEKLIPKAIIRAKMDEMIPIYGAGENVRDW